MCTLAKTHLAKCTQTLLSASMLCASLCALGADPDVKATGLTGSEAGSETALQKKLEKALHLYGEEAFQEALAFLDQCLTMQEKASGRDHPDVAAILDLQALVYLRQGERQKAMHVGERSLSIKTQTFGQILSACDSGTGEVKTGEGVMSLRRAFRIAGAETVLASHWKVSDKATSRLMREFIRRWRGGQPRAEAWRAAQLSLLRDPDFSHPYFWAAFTLTGQWR